MLVLAKEQAVKESDKQKTRTIDDDCDDTNFRRPFDRFQPKT